MLSQGVVMESDPFAAILTVLLSAMIVGSTVIYACSKKKTDKKSGKTTNKRGANNKGGNDEPKVFIPQHLRDRQHSRATDKDGMTASEREDAVLKPKKQVCPGENVEKVKGEGPQGAELSETFDHIQSDFADKNEDGGGRFDDDMPLTPPKDDEPQPKAKGAGKRK